MRRHRTPLVLALSAAILGGIAAAWVLSRPDVTEGGPLAYDEGYSDQLAFTMPLDTTYSWGLAILQNSADEDAIVESVSLQDETGTIRVVGIRAIPEATEDAVGFAPGYDPDAGQSIDGLVIPPGRGNGFQLVFGLEVEEAGRSTFDGVRVEYRVGSKHFTTTLLHAVALCAPVERYEECPAAPAAEETAS